MKKILIVSILMIGLQSIVAQKIDTLYYDSNYKGVPVKAFATYMTIVYMSNDPQYSSIEKTFYITGELQGEFTPVSIDKSDLNKSKFKGNYTTYYKSGKKMSQGSYNDSSMFEGEYLQYYESGSIALKAKYINGKIEGTLFQYYDVENSGSIETEMQGGVPKYEYVTYVDKSGNRTKYDKELKNVIQDTPTSTDRKSTQLNGKTFLFYSMNGIYLTVNITISNELGKSFIGSIGIANATNKPVIFEANKINAFVENGEKTINCKVYTDEEYSSLVGKKLSSRSFWNALGENMAAANAGVSTSTTNTGTVGYVNSAVVGVDNNGNVAAAVGSSYGASATSSQTQSYNGGAQYQANQNARNNISQYNNQLDQYKQALDQGYLKSNAIDPGQTITGNVNIKYQKGDKLILYIPLNGNTYSFEWNIAN